MFDGYNGRMTPRPVYVTPGRHPFEVALLAACLAVGALLVITGSRPPSLTRGLPEVIVTVWLALVAVGGATGLLGVYWRRLDTGLLIEFAGVVAISAACALYVAALFALNPLPTALGTGGLITGVAAGAAWRAGQCIADLLRLRRAVVAPVEIELPLLVDPHDNPSPPPPDTGGDL